MLSITETMVGAKFYYAGHNLKTQLAVTNLDDGTDDMNSIDLMFTLVF